MKLEPEEFDDFRRNVFKTIASLQDQILRNNAQIAALTAVVKAVLPTVPAHLRDRLIRDYDDEVDHQTQRIPPAMQRPEHWREWSELLAILRTMPPPPRA